MSDKAMTRKALEEVVARAMGLAIPEGSMVATPMRLHMARAALSAIEAAGWAVVPRVATEAMLDEGTLAFHRAYTAAPIARAVWTAMLSAVK